MLQVHLAHSRATHARLLLLLCTLVCGTITTAIAAGDFQFVEIVVAFNASDIDREPVCTGGSLVIANDQKSAAVSALFDIVRYKPSTNRGTVGFSYSGPWTVTILTDSNPDSLIALLNADPLVDYAELVQHEGDPNELLAGEGTRTWFPPPSKYMFCNQLQMHHRLASEDAVLVDDPCASSGLLGPFDHDMDLPQAWGVSRGDSSVVVAIIDTGCDIIHPNLGGAGPPSAVSDSMAFYNHGIWFRNWLEHPGDANADGFPGEYGVDEDGDGLFDEDSAGREPGNLAEADVITGTWSTCTALTITDASANWVPNSLIGMRFYGATQEGAFDSGLYEVVTSNTNNSLTTSGSILLNRLIASNKNGWAYVSAAVGAQAYDLTP